MNKYLVTYGDHVYSLRRNKLAVLAHASGFFDDVHVFTPQDLDQGFKERFYEILKLWRGGGYWIWKPYLLSKALDLIQEGDVLIYCDAGCSINRQGKERFDQYIDLLNSSEKGLLTFGLHFKTFEYTKMEIFKYFNSSDEIINSNCVCATVIFIQKCAHTKFIINRWLKALYDDPWLFTDVLTLPQHEKFIENRHDQSVFSVLVNMYGAAIIPDETYFSDFEIQGKAFPFWATRLRS